jgi:hypothetical protein
MSSPTWPVSAKTRNLWRILGQGDFDGLRSLKEVAGKQFHRGVILYFGEHQPPFD